MCGKLLPCGLHTCPAKCHTGNCLDAIPRPLLAPIPLPSLAPPAEGESAWDDVDTSTANAAAEDVTDVQETAKFKSCGLKVNITK